MEPLRIDWDIATPYCHGTHGVPLHLDGLLAWVVAGRAMANAKDATRAIADLPLGRYGNGDDAVWQASQLIVVPVDSVHLEAITRIGDNNVVAARRGRAWTGATNVIPIASGPMKAYAVRLTVQNVTRIAAYCIGDADAINDLLRDITSLGAVRRNGYGVVRGYTVTRDDSASERWRWRSMPAPQDGYEPVHGALRPPYWDRRTHRQVWRPLQRNVLEALHHG